MAVQDVAAKTPGRSRGWCAARRTQCAQSIMLPAPPHCPDPAIYSPLEMFAAGNAATWNSPDILLYPEPVFAGGNWGQAGEEQYLPNPTASLSNNSDVVAINAMADISCGLLGLGVGTPRVSLVKQVVTIPPGQGTVFLPLPVAAGLQAIQASRAPFNLFPGLISVYVDLSHPYDSDPGNNHGINNSIIFAGVHDSAFIPLYNFSNSSAAFNLAIVGPNTIGAALAATRMVVGSGSCDQANLTFPTRPSGSHADITVFAKDDAGKPLGGFTLRLYFR